MDIERAAWLGKLLGKRDVSGQRQARMHARASNLCLLYVKFIVCKISLLLLFLFSPLQKGGNALLASTLAPYGRPRRRACACANQAYAFARVEACGARRVAKSVGRVSAHAERAGTQRAKAHAAGRGLAEMTSGSCWESNSGE